MERIDVYDANDERTGKVIDKNDPREPHEYRRICELWVVNAKGEYLIQQRSANKKLFGGMWYCTVAGGAIAGEESVDTCLREAEEELGLVLDPSCGRRYRTITEDNIHFHIWCFFQDVALESLTPEPLEVAGVQWASAERIRAMIRDGEFIDLTYYEDFFRWAAHTIE